MCINLEFYFNPLLEYIIKLGACAFSSLYTIHVLCVNYFRAQKQVLIVSVFREPAQPRKLCVCAECKVVSRTTPFSIRFSPVLGACACDYGLKAFARSFQLTTTERNSGEWEKRAGPARALTTSGEKLVVDTAVDRALSVHHKLRLICRRRIQRNRWLYVCCALFAIDTSVGCG